MRDIREQSKRIPELALFDSHDAATDASKRARKRLWKRKGVVAAYLAFSCLIATGIALLVAFSGFWKALAAPVWLRGAFVGFCNGIAMTFFWQYAVIGRYRRLLREEMIQLGIPICVHCGYDLRGNESGVCPECGNAITMGEEASRS
ncbi:MAG TPA: hypothetical protein P5081_24730 [Phycisphaerae bacterium]|nr:hypothetical protein [Phycisphaerae bacterium]HRW56093.1 hypothetical protein [Phycisphaerae bacterium]